MTALPLHRTIDHTLLKPDAAGAAVDRLIDEAIRYRFAAVCLPPCWVGHAAERLAASNVERSDDERTAVCTVVGFPLGYVDPRSRRDESRHALAAGATELDTVINIGWLKAGDDQRVRDDLEAWVTEARAHGGQDVVLKVILETCLLTAREKARGTELVAEAGADFVKTSTGFQASGATVEDVALLAKVAGRRLQVKASAGIRDAASARAMLDAGASRIGTSAGIAIVGGS
ncbi:MAG: deoxyribose-phosphate aldolase [Acidobacteriota bacterium]